MRKLSETTQRNTLGKWFIVGTVTLGCVAVLAPGCGGDDSSTTPGPDGGGDGAPDVTTPPPDGGRDTGSPLDSGTTPDTNVADTNVPDTNVPDTNVPDAPVDAGMDAADGFTSCGADNVACSNSGSNGLCKSTICTSCTDPTDDPNCKTAYGSGGSPSWLCLAGTCAPGDCRVSADCAANANGSLCGVSTPNFCGKCTTDAQCSAASPGTPVCNTGTGVCVAGTCTPSAVNPPADCAVPGSNPPVIINPNDMCCTAVCQPKAATGFPCCPSADSTSYCTGRVGGAASCQNNVCTACPLVANFQYTVDPVGGSDAAGTGAGTAGCAFKTITRALQVIGNTPAAATTITVVGPATVSAGETFPIVLPQNVKITTSTGAVTVQVPSNKAGFALNSASTVAGGAGNTGLAGAAGAALTIKPDPAGNPLATFGIVAAPTTAPVASLAPTITNVTVQGFLNDGILVANAGVLNIAQGVTSTANGTTTARRAGLHVTGTGNAIINVPSGQAPTHFDANTNHGILVDGAGFVTITGTVMSPTAGTGTVTSNQNYAAGLWIQQSSSAVGGPPQNVINGLVSFGNTNGNGMRLHAGSNVKMRGSVSLANPNGSGVLVSFQQIGTTRISDITKIDLGNVSAATTDPGNNTFQGAAGAGNNGAAGICLSDGPNGGTLLAQGNTFRGINCATSTGPVLINKIACGNAACAGGVCDLGIIQAGNAIDSTRCTQQ